MSKNRVKKGKNWARTKSRPFFRQGGVVPEKKIFAKNCLSTLRTAIEKFVTNTEKMSAVRAKNIGGGPLDPPPLGV